jgi:hypothetical protein
MTNKKGDCMSRKLDSVDVFPMYQYECPACGEIGPDGGMTEDMFDSKRQAKASCECGHEFVAVLPE